jgi:transposase
MDYEEVPCDNNKAERKLRHFVIKRKISFGTKTEHTSDNFSILSSVLMTHWKRPYDNFFQKLGEVC